MKILVFSDLHYFGGDAENFHSDRKLVQYALPMLEALIGVAKEEGVSLAVNLGDLIQDTGDKARDLSCLSYMLERCNRFPCPCHCVLGNHDMKMIDSMDEIKAITGKPISYSIDHEGYHLVFLTTEIRPEMGTGRGGSYKTRHLAESTLQWLSQDLAKNTLPCFVFTHFPLVDDSRVNDACAYMSNRAEVKEILYSTKNVKAVFVGHQHPPRVVEENGLTYYVVGSPTFSPAEDGIPIGVYRMIEADGDRIEIHERHIVLP